MENSDECDGVILKAEGISEENGKTASLFDNTTEEGNKYASYEPLDVPGIDFATGIDLIPLSKELVKCENSLAKFGLFSEYDRGKVERKVSEMKEIFLDAVKTTPHVSLFSEEDEWLAKGSAMEGNLFPALHELSGELFREKVLGENPTVETISVLEEALADFKAKSSIHKYIIQLADIDIIVAPKIIQLTEEKWLLRSKYPNYYNIDFHGFTNSDCLLSKCESIICDGTERNILCPYKLRDAFEESVQAMCVYNNTTMSALICAPHGLAFQVVKIRLSDGIVMGDFYDIAFAVSCHFWPQCANEWIDRRRIWPDKDEIKQCVEGGVHLVSKSPTKDMENLAWRLTFAKAESMVSEKPLIYWYVLRSWSLTKSFLQEFNIHNKPNIITSYHIKTLFLYALERMPLDYWINGEYTVKTIVSIIDELTVCFATQECPHYFTPSINLFESVASSSPSSEFFSTVAKQLRRERETLIADPVEYFFRGGHEIMAAEDDCENYLKSPELT